MAELNQVEKDLLKTVTGIDDPLSGAYNLRLNGKPFAKQSSQNIEIRSKTDRPGIDIIIAPGTKHEEVHIPVILTEAGLRDLVYNDFYVGEDADVVIVAGCGIHNCACEDNAHDGIHAFHIAKNARVRYREKHYGENEQTGQNEMNPTTIVELAENAQMEMDTSQIRGIDRTVRVTRAKLAENATLKITERILTDGEQCAETRFEVDLDGENAKTHVISRSVACGHSHQLFLSRVNGNHMCTGHTECDAIIMDEASVSAKPEINANSPDARLIHEAAIGKIAGEQLIKLMTLGLTEKEAEEKIINGFIAS